MFVIIQGLGLPIVTILLEGGKEAIRIVKERLKVGIACVVIEGIDKLELEMCNGTLIGSKVGCCAVGGTN